MKGITQAAQKSNGLSRSCAKCPLWGTNKTCTPEISKACFKAFIEGFKKGSKWTEKQKI